MTIGGFIGGLIVAAVGFIFVWKADWLLMNFGAIEFAEKHLRTDGGSRLMYKIIGTIIIIIGLLIATDLMNSFLAWLIRSIFGKSMQSS